MMSDHPSFLELDLLAVGRARSRDTSTHVEACARCRAHVAAVAAGGEAVPPWLAARALARPAPAPPRRRPLAVALALLAPAVALVVLAVRPGGPPRPAPYVGDKGGASVWVYVKRGDAVTRWDESRAVQPGDQIRLQIDPAGLPNVVVVSPSGPAGGAYRVLYRGVLHDGRNSLPVAWSVDDGRDTEALVVVLGRAEIPDDRLPAVIARPDPARELVRRFVFPRAHGGGAR